MPALPIIPKNKDHDDRKFLDKLGSMMMYFLENCFLAPSLKSDKFLCRFMTDELPVSHFVQGFKNADRPRNIGQFETPDGEVTT